MIRQNREMVDLVDVVNSIGDMFKAVHESVEAFFADSFKHLFALLGTPSSRLKLISRLYRPHLHVLQSTSSAAAS